MAQSWRAIAEGLRVSRETEGVLAHYVELLKRWQGKLNLVSYKSVEKIWERHIADSAQLLIHAPLALRWLDLGSGAGLPGLVIAILLRQREGALVELIESDSRKAAFLRTVAQATEAPAQVTLARIEDTRSEPRSNLDIVTARALAPIEKLLAYAHPALSAGATGLFLKGRGVEAELNTLPESWKRRIKVLPSLTDDRGALVQVSPEVTAARSPDQLQPM
jgi:16S rRNA (guanine527-N7)-methyltransferase